MLFKTRNTRKIFQFKYSSCFPLLLINFLTFTKFMSQYFIEVHKNSFFFIYLEITISFMYSFVRYLWLFQKSNNRLYGFGKCRINISKAFQYQYALMLKSTFHFWPIWNLTLYVNVQYVWWSTIPEKNLKSLNHNWVSVIVDRTESFD